MGSAVASQLLTTLRTHRISGSSFKKIIQYFMTIGFFVSLYFSDVFDKTYLLRSYALPAFSKTEKPIFEKDLNEPGSPKMA